MKPRFYFFCSVLFLIISCKTVPFDRTLPNTDSYPNFYIFTAQRPLYALVDTLGHKVYKIHKAGNRILISTTDQEHNLNKYWIERIDSSEHNFQIISYYRKQRLKGNYKRRGKRKKKRSSGSGWQFASPIPDWGRYDTLFLNINIIESNKVSCQLSYWFDTTEVYFETNGIINYDE